MIEQIESLMQQGQWSEATTLLTEFVGNHPENSVGHAYYGICLERQKDYEGAAVQFQRAWALEPHYWEAARKLFQCYDRLGRHQDALDTAREVHKLRPSDKEIERAIVRLEEVVSAKRGPRPMAWGL